MLNARVLKKMANYVNTTILAKGDTMRKAIIAFIFFILIGKHIRGIYWNRG